MNEFKILIHRSGDIPMRYRADGRAEWALDEAAQIAMELLTAGRNLYAITIGNSDNQEFRLWAEGVNSGTAGNFQMTPTGPRWARWFVDAEIAGHRWVARPLADLSDFDDAEAIAEELGDLHPHVTRVWWGASDGSEEYELPTGPA